MSVREILLWPDPRLSQVCAPAVLDAETRALAADMLETMYAAPGRGLAGPQVGAMRRIFVMDATWKEGVKAPFVALNPELTHKSDETCEMEEGCLSIPGITATVTRPKTVTLAWTDLDGIRHSRDFDGAEARIIQHEADHLDGLVHFDRPDPAQRAELEAQYP